MTTERLLYRPAEVEVGELIGVSRARAYELIGAGTIPSIRIGNSIRVPRSALIGWIERELDAQSGSQAAVSSSTPRYVQAVCSAGPTV
jgi:excisionase family DNA binding protein